MLLYLLTKSRRRVQFRHGYVHLLMIPFERLVYRDAGEDRRGEHHRVHCLPIVAAVLIRRQACLPFEQFDEVIYILDAAFGGDVLDGFLAVA